MPKGKEAEKKADQDIETAEKVIEESEQQRAEATISKPKRPRLKETVLVSSLPVKKIDSLSAAMKDVDIYMKGFNNLCIESFETNSKTAEEALEKGNTSLFDDMIRLMTKDAQVISDTEIQKKCNEAIEKLIEKSKKIEAKEEKVVEEEISGAEKKGEEIDKDLAEAKETETATGTPSDLEGLDWEEPELPIKKTFMKPPRKPFQTTSPGLFEGGSLVEPTKEMIETMGELAPEWKGTKAPSELSFWEKRKLRKDLIQGIDYPQRPLPPRPMLRPPHLRPLSSRDMPLRVMRPPPPSPPLPPSPPIQILPPRPQQTTTVQPSARPTPPSQTSIEKEEEEYEEKYGEPMAEVVVPANEVPSCPYCGGTNVRKKRTIDSEEDEWVCLDCP